MRTSKSLIEAVCDKKSKVVIENLVLPAHFKDNFSAMRIQLH